MCVTSSTRGTGHARTVLSFPSEHAIVGTKEDGDELDRGSAAGHEQPVHERQEPPRVVAAIAAVHHVEAALPPVRKQRKPAHPLGVKTVGQERRARVYFSNG